MKAAQINQYGGPEVIQVNQKAVQPSPKNNQVLVRVFFAALNPIDWKLREGYLKEYVPLNFPVTLGGDFAGEVTQIGSGVTRFKVGDKVYGQGGVLNGGSGSLAEYVAADENKIYLKPKNLEDEASSAFPLAGISALQAVEDEIKLQLNQKILIHGGAGGIGSIAVQIAKALGGYVAATSGTKDLEFVKSLGADEVIDFQTQHFEEMLKDYDAVFDTAGKESVEKSFQILKPGGVLVSMNGQPDESLAKKFNVTAIGQNTTSNPERFKRLTELVEAGRVKAYVDKIFPLNEIQTGFTYQEHSRPRGKVIIQVL